MSAERWNSLGAFSLVAGIDDPGQRFRSGINDADYSMRAAHRAAATGLRRVILRWIARSTARCRILRLRDAELSRYGGMNSVPSQKIFHRTEPASAKTSGSAGGARPSSTQGACAPKNYSGRRDACEDLGIAADTAASTPKIKHRTSVRVHWFISDCKTKREADWQVIMDEQAL